jgi:hypothetical protein
LANAVPNNYFRRIAAPGWHTRRRAKTRWPETCLIKTLAAWYYPHMNATPGERLIVGRKKRSAFTLETPASEIDIAIATTSNLSAVRVIEAPFACRVRRGELELPSGQLFNQEDV